MREGKYIPLVALMSTPLVLLALPFIELSTMANMQEFFVGEYYFLVAFFVPAFLLYFIGYIFYSRSCERSLFYYLWGGLAFFVYLFLDRHGGLQVIAPYCCFLPFLLPRKMMSINFCFFTTVTVCLIFSVLYKILFVGSFIGGEERIQLKKDFLSKTYHQYPPVVAKAKKSNIYHIVLDQVSLENFVSFLDRTESIVKSLVGFVSYDNTVANYAFTTGSLSSIFQGKMFPDGVNAGHLFKKTFDDGNNFINDLRRAGYISYATGTLHGTMGADYTVDFMNQDYNIYPMLFEKINKSLVLFDLYRAKFLPWQNRRFYSHSLHVERPIKEVLGFQKMTSVEKTLPSNNRYTFLYLSLPHNPYILNKDCGWSHFLSYSSHNDSLECSFNIIFDFIEELKRLGRYDNSLIIIHSDHGIKLSNRHHPFLLIKRPFAKTNFTRSTLAVELLDIAPTILSEVNVSSRIIYHGQNIYSPSFEEKENRDFMTISPFGDVAEGKHCIVKKDGTVESVGITRMKPIN